MAKKNPAVLWNVDQTGDVIGAEGRTTVQGNVGLGDDFVKSSKTNKKYVTHVSRKSDGNLQVNVEQPSLSDLNATTANRSIGTNSSGVIEAQDLSGVTSSAETTTGTTYVSAITQSPNGQVSYKTQTITEATDEANSAKKGITTLTSDLYASNTRTTGHTTAVTPDGVWDAIDSLDVNNIAGFGADKTLATLTETDGKIAATFQAIAIGGGAVTLDNASQAVVTDSSKKLATKDLTVNSSTDENATNKFVSTVTADSTGKITVKKANVALDGTAITLDDANYAVVTNLNQNLTTQDLSQVTSSEASPRTGTVFVSSISQTSAGQVSYTTQYIPSIPTSTSDLYNDSGFISSTSAGNHKYLTTNGSGVATWLDKPIQRAYYANGNLAHDYADAIEILEVENSPNRKVSLLSNSVTSEKGYLVPTPIANKVLTTNSTGDISWQNATGGSRIQVQYTQTPLDVSNLLFNTSNFSINADNNDLGFYVPTIPNGLTEPLLGSYNNRPSWIEGSPIVAGDYVTINEIADNKVEIGVNTSLVDGLATSARLSGIHSSLSYQIAGVAQTAEANLWRETVTACDATLDLYDPQQAHPGEDVAYEKYLGPMEWIKLCEIEYLPNAPYYTEIVAHFNVLGKFSSWHNANSAVFIAEVYAGITVQTASSDLWVVNCGGKVVHNTAQTYANDMSIELYQSEENPNLVGVLLHCPHAENNYSRVHVEGSVHVVKGDADNVAIEREVGIDTGLDWPAWNTVEVRSGHGRTLLKSVLLTT